LSRLGFQASEEIYEAAILLTPHYILSRYPRKRAIRYDERLSSSCLRAAETIIGWCKSILRRMGGGRSAIE